MSDHLADDFMTTIIAYQCGDLTPEQHAQFELDLVNDSDRRRLFIESQYRSAAIAEVLYRDAAISFHDVRATEFMLPHQSDKQATGLLEPDDQEVTTGKRSQPWRLVTLLLVAASIMIAVLLPPRIWEAKKQHTQQIAHAGQFGFAKLTHADSAVWQADDSAAVAVGHDFVKGIRHQLASGSIRLRMHDGGIVTVAGPSSFKGINANEIELLSGRIAARLPDEDCELTVRTGKIVVRDLGTAFGITAQPDGEVGLSVFDGSVAVKSTIGDLLAEQRQFNQGESFVASDEFGIDPNVPFDTQHYMDIWPLTIGIDDATSIIELAEPGPQQSLKELANNTKLLLIPEQLNKRMEREIIMRSLQPGHSWPESQPGRAIMHPNQVVSSYLLVYVPKDRANAPRLSISGSIVFEKKILGVVIQNDPLLKSDRLFGAPEIEYDSLTWRRLEGNVTDQGNVPADSLSISEDGRRLTFSLSVSSGNDSFRVLVDEGHSP